MDCVVLTYTVPHRKTYDTLCRLKSLGYGDILVWAVPMRYKKTFVPIYEHRPPAFEDISPQSQCTAFGYEYTEAEDYEGIPGGAPILVCGAGLLPDELVKSRRVVNSHPGYIPLVRGLDALKWAIYEDLPIGATTHLIGDEVDAGEIIDRREVPIYKNDTFHALAQRVYETEIFMLADSLRLQAKPRFHESAKNHVLHKRMPKETEAYLMEKFQKLIEKHGTERTYRIHL